MDSLADANSPYWEGTLVCAYVYVMMYIITIIINPRCACAARVTVVVLSFRPSICLLPRFLPLRARRRPISETNGFSATLALFFKWHFL